jgi:hypothetical protein
MPRIEHWQRALRYQRLPGTGPRQTLSKNASSREQAMTLLFVASVEPLLLLLTINEASS